MKIYHSLFVAIALPLIAYPRPRFVAISAPLQLVIWLTVTPTAWTHQTQVQAAYELTVVTDRADAQYHVGELVTFEITFTNKGKSVRKAEIEYFLSMDGLRLSDGKVTVANGRGQVSGRLEDPGFLRCRISYDLGDGEKIVARAAAGIDPLQIKPSMPAPDD